MTRINDPGAEVPPNTIAVLPHHPHTPAMKDIDGVSKPFWSPYLLPLIDFPDRQWFTKAFKFCLPIMIGNQTGIAIQSQRSLEVYWQGGNLPLIVHYLADDNIDSEQHISTNFGHGVLTFLNPIIMRTPPMVNLLVFPPPNVFHWGLLPMTAVVESDNLHRDFTINLKMMQAGGRVRISKGDLIACVLPIPRGFSEKFQLQDARSIFSPEVMQEEYAEIFRENQLRGSRDVTDGPGGRYARGVSTDGAPYRMHQRTLKVPPGEMRGPRTAAGGVEKEGIHDANED